MISSALIFLCSLAMISEGTPFCKRTETLPTLEATQPLVLQEQQIVLPDYPDAFNPSIVPIEGGYLLSFRYCPNRSHDDYSFIGLVELDLSFKPHSTPVLLNTRRPGDSIPSHAHDGRLFEYGGELYLLYADNTISQTVTLQSTIHSYLAKILKTEQGYQLSDPLPLLYPEKRFPQNWEKNWTPFIWHNQVMIGYYPSPHEVILPDLLTGQCVSFQVNQKEILWPFGKVRGGTPALEVDGVYLAFFHSSIPMRTTLSKGKKCNYYFTGAYTFAKDPPFELIAASSAPIMGREFYTSSWKGLYVVFPGGFIHADPYIYLVYGKSDREMWVATIDKAQLMDSLLSVE